MNAQTIKHNIENTLKHFDNQPLREAATKLLNTLGYYSKRVGNDEWTPIGLTVSSNLPSKLLIPLKNSALTIGTPFSRSCK